MNNAAFNKSFKKAMAAAGGPQTKMYRGHGITKLIPSGYYEFYSDEQKRFLKFDDLEDAKAQIDSEISSGHMEDLG